MTTTSRNAQKAPAANGSIALPSERDLDRLRAAAVAASEQAYCPYSQFRVGAAVLTDSGKVFGGCNVENASFGLTICAERSALFHAVAKGERHLVALLIYTPTEAPSPPCGACRQVIRELAPNADVYSVCDGPEIARARIDDLLPQAFGPESL